MQFRSYCVIQLLCNQKVCQKGKGKAFLGQRLPKEKQEGPALPYVKVYYFWGVYDFTEASLASIYKKDINESIKITGSNISRKSLQEKG
jgi:hypothetical protein